LGIAASGKSTFTRQMRLIHEAAWSQEELETFYNIICANVFDGMKEVCSQMAKMDMEFDDKENTKRARYFRELNSAETPLLNEGEVDRIKTLWQDKNFTKCVAQMVGGSDLIVHNLTYFIDRLDDISKENYIPNDDDILYCRQRSTGATETIFVKDKVKYTLIDMGGQKPERSKWDRVLGTGIKGVFFFAAVDEFNVPSLEEKGKTKLEVALDTWKDLLGNPKLASLSIILLMNKVDLIEAKLKADFSCFTTQFKDYKGEKTKEGALKYIEELFVNNMPKDFPTDYVSCFVCCALDTSLMGKLFEEAKAHIKARSLAVL